MTSPERQLEEALLEKLRGLKYAHRADIRDRAALEKNFREQFQALNHVKLTDGEFRRLLDEIVTPDVFTAAHTRRNHNSFTRDDRSPRDKVLSNYTLVNIGVPCAQIEQKTLGINSPQTCQRGDGSDCRLQERPA